MWRSLAVASLLVIAAAAPALANGRPAGTSTINFKRGDETKIVAGMTFGMVETSDGGATWHWMCEAAIRYGGMYDPDYAYTSTGALFATTFDGALVRRDACSFDAAATGAGVFVSTLTQGPDGTLYFALTQPANPPTDPGDAKIYRSTDNGMTFPTSANPGQVNDWWSSIEVAPSDPQRVYLTGYRLMGAGRSFLLFRSDNAGESFQAMAMTGLTTTDNSTIDIVGISKTNPDHVYVRVTFQLEGAISDAIFRSINGGQTWTKIYEKDAELTFTVRANGDLVVGSKAYGMARAVNPGAAMPVFADLAGSPHVNCLVENSAGELWACTQNFGGPGTQSDNAGIMKSTDLATWTPVLRYQDILGPVECAAGTIQHDECQVTNWCGLKAQLGITADPTCCPSLVDGAPKACEGGSDGPVGNKKGCCDSDVTGAPASLGLGLVVGSVLLRRRKRR